MSKRNLTFVDMLDLEAREEGSSDSDWRSEDSDSTEVDSQGNLRDFVCKDDDAYEPLQTPGSQSSTSSDSCYQDEQAHNDDCGARKRPFGERPRRPSASDRAVHRSAALHAALHCSSCHCCAAAHGLHCHQFHPYVFASQLKSAIPMVDGFTRSLRSLREEMALSDGATEERPDGGQETKGGQDGKPPTANPGGSTHNSQNVEGSDSDEPPRPRRRLRRGRPPARSRQT